MRRFALEDRLSRIDDLLSTELDHETVLMSIDAGAYYGLTGVARSIWEKLKNPTSFSDLVDYLEGAYCVSHETCISDVQNFLAEMDREGLLRVE
ncbi:MAG TPA: PqqD family protein [Terriglobales bacterium]|nr:PqqD family protein [Terriglobales bacterium]